MEENIELGGNIELVGFSQLTGAEMVVVKKLVGNSVKKLSNDGEIEKLKVTLKCIHGTPDNSNCKYQLQGHLMLPGKNPAHSEVTDHNLFFALDSLMKKLKQMN